MKAHVLRPLIVQRLGEKQLADRNEWWYAAGIVGVQTAFSESNIRQWSPQKMEVLGLSGLRAASRSALIFPAGMPASLAWARRAAEEGIRVVGASSLAHDPARDQYPEWTSLPWIGDGNFSETLSRCLVEKKIDTVFTPHAVVWSKLRQLLPSLPPGTRLAPEQLWVSELADYHAYRDTACGFHREPFELAGAGKLSPRMPELDLSALVRAFHLTPGQCDEAKLLALVAILRRMPEGDIVEIGSFWGRSAVALAYLARHYKVGQLLCVDPWGHEEMRQGIPEVDQAADEIPIEEVFHAFRMNLAPFAGWINYSRGRSTDAARTYRAERCFTTEDFGRTAYRGSIALLHIDGNHAPAAVQEDIAAWAPLVGRNGWIIFDDYTWPFGDGVRIAADEYLRNLNGGPAVAFVAGGALFIQLKRAGGTLRTTSRTNPDTPHPGDTVHRSAPRRERRNR